jgi:hypothetical protein
VIDGTIRLSRPSPEDVRLSVSGNGDRASVPAARWPGWLEDMIGCADYLEVKVDGWRILARRTH